MPITIAIASKGDLKCGAAEDACKTLGVEAEFIRVDAPSNENEQPEGLDETFHGAQSRMNFAWDAVPKADVIIAIESGVRFRHGRWHDFAVILVVFRHDASRRQQATDDFLFPTDAVDEARRLGFKTTTVGSIIAKQLGGAKDDPHATLSGGRISRRKILHDALVIAMKDVPKLAAAKKGTP